MSEEAVANLMREADSLRQERDRAVSDAASLRERDHQKKIALQRAKDYIGGIDRTHPVYTSVCEALGASDGTE